VTELERDFTFSLTKYPSLIFVFLVVGKISCGGELILNKEMLKNEGEKFMCERLYSKRGKIVIF